MAISAGARRRSHSNREISFLVEDRDLPVEDQGWDLERPEGGHDVRVAPGVVNPLPADQLDRAVPSSPILPESQRTARRVANFAARGEKEGGTSPLL